MYLYMEKIKWNKALLHWHSYRYCLPLWQKPGHQKCLVLENRAAQGDITAPGGARRLTGDQTAALRDSLSDKPAKNIILLIGDGMGTRKLLPHAIMPKVRAAF